MEEQNFDEMFVFENEALRLSVLPFYDCGEIEDVKSFMNGKTFDDSFNKEWRDSLAAWKKEGKNIQRIRVLPEKTNDYNRYETMVWIFNSLAGEEHLFIKESDYKEILNSFNLNGDFWILDKTKVLALYYDKNNDYMGSKIITENSDKYLEFYNNLLDKCLPLETVLKNVRQNINEII